MGQYIPAPEGDASPGVAPGGKENQILRKASDLNYDTEWVDQPSTVAGPGGGTVSSVGLAVPAGFSVSGSPVTTSGNITLAFAAGYSLPTDAKQSQWDTAYSVRYRWDGSATGLNASTGRASLGLGGAATLNVGSAAGNVVQLDGSGKLPAVDGSQLTNLPSGGGSSFAGYAVGNWILPAVGTAGAGSTSVLGTIYLQPFVVNRSITVDQLGVRVSTAQASSQFQLAIYGSVDGLPSGTALGSTGSLSSAAVTTVSGAVTPFNLTAGQIYWAASNVDVSGVVFQNIAGANSYFSSILGTSSLSEVSGASTVTAWNRTRAQAFGTWPDLTGLTTTVVGASATLRGAAVFLKVSALL